MPDFGPGNAVIILGLVSALTWGAGDFAGGLMARRIPLFGVVAAAQAVGMVAALAFAILRGEPVPQGRDLVIAVMAGFCGVVGMSSLYRGLAVGRMGIVAPLTGVLAAVIPVCVGFLRDGVPHLATVIGIAVALAAVVLVTRSPGHDDRPTGAKWGFLAGTAIGLFNVTIGSLSSAGAFGPLVIVRLVQAVVLVGLIVAWRQPWRMHRTDVAKLAGVGLLDMAGNASFIIAAQTGALAVASVLSSLYPVTTVVLAIAVLRERLTRSHVIGIALTAAAIVLISLGTA